MLKSLIFLFFLASCHQSRQEMEASAIVHGTEVKDPGTFAVAIAFRGNPQCTGVIISRRSILTAGHCLEDDDVMYEAKDIEVNLGSTYHHWSSDPGKITVPVKALHLHPDYYSRRILNDIGIIELAEEIPSSYRSLPLYVGPDMRFLVPVESYGFSVYTESSTTDLFDYLGEAPERLESKNFERTPGLIRLQAKLLFALDQREKGGEVHFHDKVLVWQHSGGLCGGDSGGPTVMNLKGKKYLHSINSSITTNKFGEASCSREGKVTLVSAHVGWITETLSKATGESPKTNAKAVTLKDFKAEDVACMKAYDQAFNQVKSAGKEACRSFGKLKAALESGMRLTQVHCSSDLSRSYAEFLENTRDRLLRKCPGGGL